MSEPQRPNTSFRAGRVSASIWEDHVERDDRTEIRHSIKIEKRYRPKDSEEYRSTNCFFPNELADLEDVVRSARQFLRVRQTDNDVGAKEPST